MQQVEYSKEYCVMYDSKGSCKECQDKGRCTIYQTIRQQTDDMYGRLIVGIVIGAFLLGLWIT